MEMMGAVLGTEARAFVNTDGCFPGMTTLVALVQLGLYPFGLGDGLLIEEARRNQRKVAA